MVSLYMKKDVNRRVLYINDKSTARTRALDVC